MHYYSSWKLSGRKTSWMSQFCSLRRLLKIGVINWILAFPLEWNLYSLLECMVDVREREWEEVKSSELLAQLLWPSGYWEEWATFQWGCLILGSLRVWGVPHWSPYCGCWLAVETWLLFCCWLILPAKFLLKTQNIVYMLQRVRFFFLQGMILVGNRPCLIQSIANVIIKCSLISILIWWGDNSFFFKTELCLLKIVWPALHKKHISAHP